MWKHNGLKYYLTVSLQNWLLRLKKKPLKALGTIVIVAYFCYLPFQFKSVIELLHLDSPKGFIVAVALGNLYITAPSLLSYLKRKGLNFQKSHVNLMFVTPMSPLQILYVTMVSQVYISLIFSFVIAIAGIYIFKLTLIRSLLYVVADLLIYNVSMYGLGIIMYSDYRISQIVKLWIRRLVFAVMAIVLLYLGIKLYVEGVTFDALFVALTNPVLFVIPLVGQGIALTQLIVLGPTIYNVVGSGLLLVLLVLEYVYIKTIPNDGDYYEDALRFSEDIAIRTERAKKGKIFSSKHEKRHEVNKPILNTQGARIIFERQVLENRRTRKYYIGLFDLIILVGSCVVGFIIYQGQETTTSAYFTGIHIFVMYLTVFFPRKTSWLYEFDNVMFYLIPESNFTKLLYANILDYIYCFIRAICIVVPSAIGAGINPLMIPLVILSTSSIIIVVSAAHMVFDDYIAIKLGQMIGSFVSLFSYLIVLFIPGLLVILGSIFEFLWVALMLITLYSVIVTTLLFGLGSRLFSNREALRF